MKGLDSGPGPARADSGTGTAPRLQEPVSDFPVSLAEALDILADRARRHGLIEVVHLIEVAALAARDAVAPAADDESQP